MRVFRAPAFKIAENQLRLVFSRLPDTDHLRIRRFALPHRNFFRQSRIRSVEKNPYFHARRIIFRRDHDAFQIRLRHPFHPDTLPDAALRGVKHAARRKALLSAALPVCVRLIAYFDGKFVLSCFEIRRKIHRKREIPSEMASCTLSVAVNHRILIHRAELQQQTFSVRNFGKLNRTEVPQIFFWKQLPLHTGRIALWGKRDENFSVPLFWHFLRFRERILPPSVQILPVFPAHLRTRVFRKRELFFRIFPKFRRKAEFFSFLFSNL